MLNWLNAKRIRDYPRLILIASWSVILLNLLFHRGWTGGLTGIMIGGDFISNYSGGVLYKTDIKNLYNPVSQQANQAGLITPSVSPGFAPFISPPNVALAMSWISSIPLTYALVIWEIINLACAAYSAYLMAKFILPSYLTKPDLSAFQILIIILSSFAFVVGFIAGQSHGIILLIFTGILLAMRKERWMLAGILGSLLLFKPQFVLGFLVCWAIWRRLAALLSFSAVALLWQIPVILTHGFLPYMDYLKYTKSLLYLPYAGEGFPISIMATPYALLASLLPVGMAKPLQYLFILIFLSMAALLSYIAYKAKDQPANQRYMAYSLAILFPLVVAPHTLIYDFLILVPVIVLLANISELIPGLKIVSIGLYVSIFLFPIIGYPLKLAVPGLVPLAVMMYLLQVYFRPKTHAASS